jgi:hypothetical protein
VRELKIPLCVTSVKQVTSVTWQEVDKVDETLAKYEENCSYRKREREIIIVRIIRNCLNKCELHTWPYVLEDTVNSCTFYRPVTQLWAQAKHSIVKGMQVSMFIQPVYLYKIFSASSPISEIVLNYSVLNMTLTVWRLASLSICSRLA